MRAMLLTAGHGLHMLPLTRTMPKPAIPVLGRPIVLQILEQLARGGVERTVLNLHHLPGRLRRLIEDAEAGPLPEIVFTEEEEILGTAGGIGNAARLLRGAGPILVRNSDFLADIDIAALTESHRRSGMQATLVLAPERPGYSRVDVDGEGHVIAIAGWPEVEEGRVAASYLFTGCQIIEESVLDSIPQEGPSDIVRDVCRYLAEEGALGSFVHRRFWWEFGSPELHLDGSLALLDLDDESRKRIAVCDPVVKLDSAVAALGEGSSAHETARLSGRAALGAFAQLDESVALEDSILMPGAVAEAGCRLRRALVAPEVRLPAGTVVDGALACRSEDGLRLHPFVGGEGPA